LGEALERSVDELVQGEHPLDAQQLVEALLCDFPPAMREARAISITRCRTLRVRSRNRATTSAGVPGRPRVRLFGQRRASAS
jgi:hypothetical protein